MTDENKDSRVKFTLNPTQIVTIVTLTLAAGASHWQQQVRIQELSGQIALERVRIDSIDSGVKDRLDRLESRLDRFEAKLDRLIEAR